MLLAAFSSSSSSRPTGGWTTADPTAAGFDPKVAMVRQFPRLVRRQMTERGVASWYALLTPRCHEPMTRRGSLDGTGCRAGSQRKRPGGPRNFQTGSSWLWKSFRQRPDGHRDYEHALAFRHVDWVASTACRAIIPKTSLLYWPKGSAATDCYSSEPVTRKR
jgi:hypothetical protein